MTYHVDIKAATDIKYTVQSATDYYPYGKALRSYGKERYQSTYHERGVESGFDYRGARFYDSDVARFNSLDPLAEKFVSESPFIYVGNNPIYYIDPDGKFKFPAHLEQYYKDNYPNFYNYIKNEVREYFTGSDRIMNSLNKYSVGQLTNERVNFDTKFGNGPTIRLQEFSNKGQNGEYYYRENEILISSALVQQFESILSNPSASKNKKLAIAIALNQTLINEFTHYGDALDGIDAIMDENGNVINGEDGEGGMISEFDEGNAAVQEIFKFYGSSLSTGLQNLLIHSRGMYINGNTLEQVGEDKSLIDNSLIPPVLGGTPASQEN